ncbi:MAG: hypothetical protein SA339_04295 [Methanomassiliicoccus sp.]|nr:hypothetical protein [Methanomassiliicoccus sp.]
MARYPLIVLLSFMVLAIPFVAIQGAAASPEATTSVQSVAVQGNVSGCHIAVDLNGNAHLCYFNEDDGKLMYATNAGGEWAIQTIADRGEAGRDCSIAVDSNGIAHVSFVGNINDGYGDLIYAAERNGSWESRVIDPGYVLGSTSIAIDPKDRVCISYHTGHEASNDDLMYATNADGKWSTEVVDTGISGYYNALAVDLNGNAHILSYAGIGGMPLKYSTNAGGSWSTQNVEDSVWIGSYCSIATDSLGRPHAAISTSDKIGQVDLKHVLLSESSWEPQAIESGGYVWSNSIAVDGNEAVHIAYRSATDGSLKYATNAGGEWTTRTIDNTAASSACASIAVDREGNVHMCYIATDASGDHLRYAEVKQTKAAETSTATEQAADPAVTEEGATFDSPSTTSAHPLIGGLEMAGLAVIATAGAILILKRRLGP